MVLYGHTPTPTPEWINNTMCLDTGVVFGGRLTALRYPTRELVSVPAHAVHYAPAKPLAPAVERPVHTIDVADVLGRRVVETAYHGRVGVREDNAAAAIEVMSRFAVDPRWLLLPAADDVRRRPPPRAPTCSSIRPRRSPVLRRRASPRCVCEEKHMGSRAIVVVAASAEVAARRFGVDDGTTGAIYTRTGRPFFGSAADRASCWPSCGPRCPVSGPIWARRLGRARRRAAALVGQGRRAAAPPVRRGRCGGPGRAAGRRRRAHRGRVPRSGRVGPARRDLAPARQRHRVHRRLRPLLLADGRPRRRPARAVPGAGGGGRELRATRDHGWHLAMLDRLVAAAPDLLAPTGGSIVDPARRRRLTRGSSGGRRSPRPAAKAWWSSRTTPGPRRAGWSSRA